MTWSVMFHCLWKCWWLVKCSRGEKQKPHPWHWVISILSLTAAPPALSRQNHQRHKLPSSHWNISFLKVSLLQIHLIIYSHLWISPLKTSQDLPSSYQVHPVHFTVPLSCEVVLHLLQLYIYPGVLTATAHASSGPVSVAAQMAWSKNPIF